ncbi:hypothetical protein [Bacillus sp. OTU530]|uniref:hypothetical protein n=1 Tax=Bacillus sp. OTU530 TaxID=3043862 RepID=UPI00313D6027
MTLFIILAVICFVLFLGSSLLRMDVNRHRYSTNSFKKNHIDSPMYIHNGSAWTTSDSSYSDCGSTDSGGFGGGDGGGCS